MKTKPKKILAMALPRYQCGHCYDTHTTLNRAEKCCRRVSKVHVCHQCGTAWDTQSQAKRCCVNYECLDCGDWFDTEAEAKKCDCDT